MAGACVIGLGNRHRSDDAVGLEVARALRDRVPPGVSVEEHDGDPLALLDRWEGARLVVLVDATCSDGKAGTIRRVEAVDGLVTWPRGPASTHAFGLAETVEMGRALGRTPGRLVIWGIEGAHFGMGTTLSPPVAAAIPEVAEHILGELARTEAGEERHA